MILFTSHRPLERAENIHAVYDGYDGEKRFFQTSPSEHPYILSDPSYRIRVTDEFISSTPRQAILIGHGIAGGKLVGLDQPIPFHRKQYSKYLTYIVTTSEEMIPLVARQSGVPESKVLPLGMPRTDAYFTRKRDHEKRTYLYVPTYRTKEETPLPEIDWKKIDSALTDEEVLIVKPHMLTGRLTSGRYDHIVEVSPMLPSTPYLMSCDVVITDYSSIMLDAHILETPVILFEKNEGYLKTRGMYLDYPYEYSSRYCTNEDDLILLMKTAYGQTDVERRCRQKTAGMCDGHSTERVVKLIREML